MVTNFITKIAQTFGDFFGRSENHCFLRQTGEAIFGQLLEKLGRIFISTSGHTGLTCRESSGTTVGHSSFEDLLTHSKRSRPSNQNGKMHCPLLARHELMLAENQTLLFFKSENT